MTFDIRPVNIAVVQALCRAHHGYGSAGNCAAYAFAVFENERPVAAYAWQPPPLGAAKAVCPEVPQAVLALSRMVAINKNDRQLKHISKPLRVQMKRLIDRTRWPVLVTYSDEGQGHTGYVYKCSGWTPTSRVRRPFFVDVCGVRVSSYANGKSRTVGTLVHGGTTTLQRWEHWICARGHVAEFMAQAGWIRREVPGRVWRSGNQVYEWAKPKPGEGKNDA